MKTQTIIADPGVFLQAGVRCVLHLALLIHLGRCGLQGATIPAMVQTFGQPYESIRYGIDHLIDLGMVAPVYRKNTSGRASVWVVTKKAWSMLTLPGDFTPFPNSQTPLLVK